MSARDEHAPHDEPPFFSAADACLEAIEQATEAIRAIQRPVSDYLRFPWRDLHGLVGMIPPGELHYVVAFSGSGKTTFLMSLADVWEQQGTRVHYLGLETRAHVLRTQWACRRLQRTTDWFDVHPGDALKGVLRERVEAREPHAIRCYNALQETVLAHAHDRGDPLLRFVPGDWADLTLLEQSTREAVDRGARVVIIDHIDHVDDEGRPPIEATKRVNRLCLSLAQDSGCVFLVASQANGESLKGDPLGVYRPPQPNHVWMGGLKRQVADGMIGLSRKLQPAPVPTNDDVADERAEKAYATLVKRARAGDAVALEQLIVPNTMEVVLMKDRAYGRERATALLGVTQGRVTDLPDAERRDVEAAKHRIRLSA
jgi:KaiC/GvpD/RAD55 family RecA-like ATPase